MQRDSNNQIKLSRAQSNIVHRFQQPIGNGMTEMQLTIVFELQNNKANDTATAIGGDGGIECEGAAGTVTTGKLALNRAGKWLRTFCTKRRNDALRLIKAILTYVILARDRRAANCAYCRVKKRRDCA